MPAQGNALGNRIFSIAIALNGRNNGRYYSTTNEPLHMIRRDFFRFACAIAMMAALANSSSAQAPETRVTRTNARPARVGFLGQYTNLHLRPSSRATLKMSWSRPQSTADRSGRPAKKRGRLSKPPGSITSCHGSVRIDVKPYVIHSR